MNKSNITLSLIMLLLQACQAASTPIPTLSACDDAGATLRSTLDSTTRGYSYDYEIYLPPCYNSDTQRQYPVVYLVPGRGSGPGAWFAAGVTAVAEELILNHELPPFIIVSTENTDAEPYGDTIVKDLLPYIENHYRIYSDRKHWAVAGGSLGGIAAYRIAFSKPDRFASAGLFGSGLIAGEEAQFQQLLQAIPTNNRPRVFLNTGEQDPLMLDRALVMIAVLDQAGVSHTSIVSEGGHNYTYWVSNFAEYLRWVAKDW